MNFRRYGSWNAQDIEMEEMVKKENSSKQKLTCPLVALFSRTLSIYWITFAEVPSSQDLWELMPRASKLETTSRVIPWAKNVLTAVLVVPSIQRWAIRTPVLGGSLGQGVGIGGMNPLIFG